MNLTPQRRDYLEETLKKEWICKYEECSKGAEKSKWKEETVANQSDKPQNEVEEEQQLKLAIEISNIEAKKKGVHIVKVIPLVRKQSTISI